MRKEELWNSVIVHPNPTPYKTYNQLCLSSGYRLPTKEEWEELINKFSCTCTDRFAIFTYKSIEVKLLMNTAYWSSTSCNLPPNSAYCLCVEPDRRYIVPLLKDGNHRIILIK